LRLQRYDFFSSVGSLLRKKSKTVWIIPLFSDRKASADASDERSSLAFVRQLSADATS